MASSDYAHEKRVFSVATTQHTSNSPLTTKRSALAAARAWTILLVHGGSCLGLALSLALGLNGYEAGDASNPHYVEGKLLLRVSDITTLISVALVVIKVIIGMWSTMVLWAAGQYFATNDAPSRTVLKMIRWKLPPWLLDPKNLSHNPRAWAISAALVAVLIQAFINPIITGSVNWNTAFHISSKAVSVSSVAPTASFSSWYWYNAQGAFDKRAFLRSAAGYANLAWGDPSTVDDKGQSLVGNGCRHVVNDDGLPSESILADAILPCIDIKGIHWYRSMDEIDGNEWDLGGGSLTLVNDDPYYYYRAGVTLVFDPKKLHTAPASTDKPPPATKFSGTMTVALMLYRRHYETDPPCNKLPNTEFGDIGALPYLVLPRLSTAGDENCYLLGKIEFGAGVTRSRRATYVSPRVVADTTPIGEVSLETDPWVQEALWLLPDLLAMLAVMDVSLPPKLHNIDGFVAGIVRQAYLGAWDVLSRGFDEQGPQYSAFPAESRLLADVSFARVFVWLALSLLMTVSGIWVLAWALRASDWNPPQSGKTDGGGGVTEVAKEVWQSLLGAF